MTGSARATARAAGLRVVAPSLAVDTADCAPEAMRRFRAWNPFHVDARAPIDVPGRPGVTSLSVEAVWQGLKLVGGRDDPAMFAGAPYKRPSDDERARDEGYRYEQSVFAYGDAVLDLVTARYAIYLPAYLEGFVRRAPYSPVGEVRAALSRGDDVVFYDWDDNDDPDDPRASFSHSALLAWLFGGRLAGRVRAGADRLSARSLGGAREALERAVARATEIATS